jgi:hypothetical protein
MNWKDLEGNGYGLMKVPSQQIRVLLESDENNEKSEAGKPNDTTEIRKERLPSTVLHQPGQFGHFNAWPYHTARPSCTLPLKQSNK